MSNRLIVLDEGPNMFSVDELRKSGFIPAVTGCVRKDNDIAEWLTSVFERDGAEIVNDDSGTKVIFTKAFKESYFKYSFEEYKRWAEKAASMDFEDFMTYRGAIKFEDAERWFSKPNNIYVWNCGWYSTLSDFLRNVIDGDAFYIGNSFYI